MSELWRGSGTVTEPPRPLFERYCRACGRVFTHPAQYRKEVDARKYAADLWKYWCRYGCPRERP